jgi:hypothetical protein
MRHPGSFLLFLVAASLAGIDCGKDLGPGSGPAPVRQIDDFDHVRRSFFFLVDPVDPLLTGQLLPLDQGGMPPPAITDLRVWRDDRNQQNNGSAVPGVAYLDPSQAAAPDSVFTQLDPLREQEDYLVRTDLFTVLLGPRLHRYAVLELLSPIGSNEVLAAAFTATYTTPEGQELEVRYGPDGKFTVFDEGGQFYSRSDYWYPVRRLELRNIYSLGARDIDVATLQLAVKKREGLDPLHFPDQPGATYLRGLGVDRLDAFGGPYPDDRIDEAFVKPAEGLVVLPDLRPFAPAAEDSVWPFFRADILASPPGRPAFFVGEPANRAIYDKRPVQVNPSLDRKYYFDVSF